MADAPARKPPRFWYVAATLGLGGSLLASSAEAYPLVVLAALSMLLLEGVGHGRTSSAWGEGVYSGIATAAMLVGAFVVLTHWPEPPDRDAAAEAAKLVARVDAVHAAVSVDCPRMEGLLALAQTRDRIQLRVEVLGFRTHDLDFRGVGGLEAERLTAITDCGLRDHALHAYVSALRDADGLLQQMERMRAAQAPIYRVFWQD